MIDFGRDKAMKSVFVPPEVKAIVTAGKVVYSTGETLKVTGDLTRALHAGADSGIKGVADIVKSIPGFGLARIGSNVAIDLYEGKDLKSVIEERGEEALKNVSTKLVGDNVAKVAFDLVKDLHNGESIKNVVSKSCKTVLLNYAIDNPDSKAAMKFKETGKIMQNTHVGRINSVKDLGTYAQVLDEKNIHDIDNIRNG
ncbi:uncharacterized protein LOC129577832 [Sitodiplosis mosellana]|uniref:uncharacterized protein LOC129577832 n=1 Tax=Sitodiplosis mosellana TaxID=263140 RepID=UPI0024453569|nr:uncharacterized protein LOC129577832 [Sitodiplosis mosellana]